MKIAVTFLAFLLFLAACATDTSRQTATETRPEARAEERLAAGDYSAAASEFLRLAAAHPARETVYRLRAIDAYLEAGRPGMAAEFLAQTTVPEESRELALERTLLEAKLALHRDRADAALALLDMPLPDFAGAEARRTYHRLRARALERQQRFRDAVRARLALADYLEAETAADENAVRLWDSLAELDDSELQKLAGGAAPDLAGWVELAAIHQRLWARTPELEAAIDSWGRTHPNHPARPEVTRRILDTSRELQLRPRSIALLLPLSGGYQRAAEAIREGFISAWYRDSEYRPEIRVYDTDSLNIEAIYQQAQSDGAELIVGPLEKNAIRTLAGSGSLSTATLALNRIDAPNSAGGELVTAQAAAETAPLYQFALAPEDEVRQIARRGLFEELDRALAITPDGDWGDRLSDTFSTAWKSGGGRFLESVTYRPESQDFISPVKRLLNIDTSEARIRRLQQTLNRNIIGDSRVRQDAELIFMAAVPVAARQIVPQFRFFGIADLPVYSSSHTYTGNPDPRVDADMNGVEFTDIPWVLREPLERPPLQVSVEENWSARSSSYRRLYAFGVDAFQVIPHLGRMAYRQAYYFQGHTGDLFMRDDGRIQRYLQWARFVDGTPVHLEDIGYGFEDGPEFLPDR